MEQNRDRVLLIDSEDARRRLLAKRLSAQGYEVEEASEPTRGAEMALRAPPAAVIAQLWMPTVSGVQLCRLLRAEPATMDVPIILCGDRDEPRDRFWAERAGATSYVLSGRTGDLLRALSRAVSPARRDESFFVQISGGSVDIMRRIARHLDTALFESVIASELRALASAGSVACLFDSLAQLVSQLARYRWLAIASEPAGHFAIHHCPSEGSVAEGEARLALGCGADPVSLRLEDDDAAAEPAKALPITRDVFFGAERVARFAFAPCASEDHDAATRVADLVSRELGGAIAMTRLVEQSQRLARTDGLTGLMNRRAFVAAMETELSRSAR